MEPALWGSGLFLFDRLTGYEPVPHPGSLRAATVLFDWSENDRSRRVQGVGNAD